VGGSEKVQKCAKRNIGVVPSTVVGRGLLATTFIGHKIAQKNSR
jgi:hypothetical protein